MKRLLIIAAAWSLFAVSDARAEQLMSTTQIGPFGILIGFDSANPLWPNYARLMNGLQNNENVVGISSRASDGAVFVLATTPGSDNSHSSVYQINLATGNLTTAIAQLNPDLDKDTGTSTHFGTSFDPANDLLRVVSDRDQNLVIDVNNGNEVAEIGLFYAPLDVNFGADPTIVHLAYNVPPPAGNVAPAVPSPLYGIDTNLGILTTLAGNTGVLATVGDLGVTVQDESGGFDIDSSGNAYAVLKTFYGLQLLYQIDLDTGAATQVGFASLGFFNLRGLTAANIPAMNAGVARRK